MLYKDKDGDFYRTRAISKVGRSTRGIDDLVATLECNHDYVLEDTTLEQGQSLIAQGAKMRCYLCPLLSEPNVA